MASPAQPSTSQTTIPSLDGLKPSINASGDSWFIQAMATNDAFPASPADITVGQLSAQVATGGQFNFPGVNGVPAGFSVSASANSALAAYQNSANLPSDLGFADTDGQHLNVSFLSDGKSRFPSAGREVEWCGERSFGPGGTGPHANVGNGSVDLTFQPRTLSFDPGHLSDKNFHCGAGHANGRALPNG